MATISSNIVSYNSDHSYYSISNASQGYANSTSSNYATVNLTRGSSASSYIYWEFSLPTIPDNATIDSISCNYRAGVSSTSTRYIASATIQMCSNKTTKGSSKSIMSTSPSASSFTSAQMGTWTVAEINAGVKLKTSATRGTSSTNSNYAIRFYGADIEIEYTEATGNKVYIKVSGTWKEASDVLVKHNGNWISFEDVYKKVNGSWTQQDDPSIIFDEDKLYINSYTFPTGYTKLRYLESNNAQMIDTNYIVQETDTIEVDYELTSTGLSQSGDKFIIGAADNTNGSIWVETYNNTNTWYYRFGSSASSNRTYGSFASGTFAIKKQHFSVGNTDNSINYASMPQASLTLFGRTNASNVFRGAWVRISEVRIKNGTKTVHKYVPARRNSDNELGMLDLIDNVFYTNIGTGTFSYA